MEATEMLTGVTRAGAAWVPRFALEIDGETCIGCGRCFKVCGRAVMHLVPVDEDGAVIQVDEDEDLDDVECARKVMFLTHPEACVGCEACARVCPKDCYTHGPVAA